MSDDPAQVFRDALIDVADDMDLAIRLLEPYRLELVPYQEVVDVLGGAAASAREIANPSEGQ